MTSMYKRILEYCLNQKIRVQLLLLPRQDKEDILVEAFLKLQPD